MASKRSNSTSSVGCLSFQLVALKDIDSSLVRLKGSPRLGQRSPSRRKEVEPYLDYKNSAIFIEMRIGTSKIYRSKHVRLIPRGTASLACIFDELFSINLHIQDLSNLTASQKDPNINIRIFCLQKRNIHQPVLMGTCKIPFIHLNESMVEENVQIILNSNFFAVFQEVLRPVLQCKVQWSMSMSQSDFDAILLKEVVSENVRYSSAAAHIVHNEALSLSTSNENFLRFLVASEELFNVVDLALDILLWQRPAITALLLMMCNCICLYGLSFAVVGPLLVASMTLWFFVNPSSYINGHKREPNSADDNESKLKDNPKHVDDYVPRSRRGISLDDKLNNFKSIQNFMKIFSDLVDGLFYFFEVQLNDPQLRIRLRGGIVGTVVLCISLVHYIPTYVLWLSFWWLFFLCGNPYIQAVVAILRFKFYRMKEKNTKHKEYINETIRFDNLRDKAFVTTEYTRWWVGAGWRLQSFYPVARDKCMLPEHLEWKGLWEVDLYDDDHEYEYNSGFAGDNDWHEVMRSSDFLRRRRWIRRVKKGKKRKEKSNSYNKECEHDDLRQTSQSHDEKRFRTFSSSSASSDENNGQTNDEKGTVTEFVIYENERWWVGTGFRHKFWPTENVYKFTDSNGNPKKMTEIDEAEKVFQSDGKSRWIDHWHIVEGGWHYATDFSDATKFKRKVRMGSWDYCRRRKWVRHLKSY